MGNLLLLVYLPWGIRKRKKAFEQLPTTDFCLDAECIVRDSWESQGEGYTGFMENQRIYIYIYILLIRITNRVHLVMPFFTSASMNAVNLGNQKVDIIHPDYSDTKLNTSSVTKKFCPLVQFVHQLSICQLRKSNLAFSFFTNVTNARA